jgi:hypothetical protein
MVDEALRRRIWNEMIAADTRCRYFNQLASRTEMFDRVLRVALIFFSSATAATVLGVFPSGAEWLAVVSAALAAVSGTMQHGRAALKFAEFSVFWGRLHRDYEELWNDVETYAITPAEAVRRLRSFQDKPESIDRQASTSRTRRKLMLDCLADAEKMALAR